MASISLPSAPDQSVSPNKQPKNPKRNARSFVSNARENLAPANSNTRGGGGLLFAPPSSLYFSYPPSSASVFNPLYHSHLQNQQQQQPPLLPLPIPNKPPQNAHASRSRGVSCPPAGRKTNRTRDQSLTPKKPKQSAKREEPKKTYVITSTNIPSGPDPNDVPKDVVSKVFLSSSISGKDLETFSGSLLAISPPPSSLPLPKFSLRPNLSCNAEASGNIDAGATDNLRRLLRLR